MVDIIIVLFDDGVLVLVEGFLSFVGVSRSSLASDACLSGCCWGLCWCGNPTYYSNIAEADG